MKRWYLHTLLCPNCDGLFEITLKAKPEVLTTNCVQCKNIELVYIVRPHDVTVEVI